MNLEAAKAVKYGGVPEEEALKFVTLNPARQLRIEQRVGSLEPGKDGDFAVWSGSPLDSGSRCLQTWIEGRKYFDINLDVNRTKSLQEERDQLLVIAKMLQEQDSKKPSDARESPAGFRFFNTSLEHQFDYVERHCLDYE